jgi:hypothetical protein
MACKEILAVEYKNRIEQIIALRQQNAAFLSVTSVGAYNNDCALSV